MCNFYVKLKIFERRYFGIFRYFKKPDWSSKRKLLQITIGNMYVNHRKQTKKPEMQYY